MAKAIEVNTTITNSIPIDKGLKRYLINWFDRMCRCNGETFAVDRAKELNVILKDYISNPNRLKKVDEYADKMPIRKNKRLYQIFSYGDSNPHAILAFLKFYLGTDPLEGSLEDAQDKMESLLNQINHDPGVPLTLKTWFSFLKLERKELSDLYRLMRKPNNKHPYSKVVLHHTYKEWMGYWAKWKHRLLAVPRTEFHKPYGLKDIDADPPSPSIYSDYDQRFNTSGSFQKDAQEFLGYFPDARSGVETVPLNSLDWLLYQADTDRVFNSFEFDEIVDTLDPDYWYVGEIHYIPKSGTNDLRPIAVPNRFLQRGLRPFQEFLYKVLRTMDKDHTFDQGKTEKYVQNRVDRGHYVSSVDLSKATEYLPKSVGDFIVDELIGDFTNEDIECSRELFDFMSRAPWKNGSHLSSWKVGQPLGTYPSFGMLAISHNLLCEALSLHEGYLHSPYVVLGDDVLLFSKRMRRAYISQMHELGVPLSLHKSYEHRLVEFAGRVFIKNQPTRFLPDPSRVNWYNLFDYSRNSGFLISYRELPYGIRNRLDREAAKIALPGDKFYRTSAELYFAYYGSPYHSYSDFSLGVLPNYVQEVESREKVLPDPEFTSGWSVLSLQGEERLSFIGKARVNTLATPEWKKRKFKPTTTDRIISASTVACSPRHT